MSIPRVLTVAGSDSGGGAGIQADLKTLNAIGVFGMSALTAITAQNTKGVFGIHELPPSFVQLQIKVVLEDIGADAIKTGMLSSREIIRAVAESLRASGVRWIVVDPVMRAKGGDPLLKPEAQEALINEILPLASVLTPNIPEAEALSGTRINDLDKMKEAAVKIKEMGPEYVLVKGGHLKGDEAVDVLYDGHEFKYFRSPFIKTKNTHGTGCTYASAIAGFLAKGYRVEESIKNAKDFVTGAIKNSLPIGGGHGPLNHFWQTAKNI